MIEHMLLGTIQIAEPCLDILLDLRIGVRKNTSGYIHYSVQTMIGCKGVYVNTASAVQLVISSLHNNVQRCPLSRILVRDGIKFVPQLHKLLLINTRRVRHGCSCKEL